MSPQAQVYTVQPVGYVRASDSDGRYEIQLLFHLAARMGLRPAGQLEIEMGVGEEDTFAQNSLLIPVAAP